MLSVYPNPQLISIGLTSLIPCIYTDPVLEPPPLSSLYSPTEGFTYVLKVIKGLCYLSVM